MKPQTTYQMVINGDADAVVNFPAPGFYNAKITANKIFESFRSAGLDVSYFLRVNGPKYGSIYQEPPLKEEKTPVKSDLELRVAALEKIITNFCF